MNVKKEMGLQAEAALQPTEFSYSDNNKLNAIIIEDQPWFIAKDICDVLGLANARKAVSVLDADEKLMSLLVTSGQRRKVNLINESGLYNLIFRSNKPEAKSFRRWVTTEVLPSLRREGKYEAKKDQVQIEEKASMHKEGELFLTALGGMSICCVWKEGKLWAELGVMSRWVGYEHGIQRDKVEPGHLITEMIGKQERRFVDLEGVEQMLPGKQGKVSWDRIDSVYRLFKVSPPAEVAARYGYKFSVEEMIEIMKELNHKPVNKGNVLALLFKGGER